MSGFHAWASKPPMGWNSWDCFATTVTEAQVKAQADYMATHLAKWGWQYIVVDIQWYEPGATGFAYRAGAAVTLDAHGRFLPAPNRFPACTEGFAPLAAYVHRLGLKFGVHLLRGVPRAAVDANLPILGSASRARDIANPDDTCPWNPDMYGVDMSKPGAQAYYDSVFAAFAAWGVDYVKVDDISRPYHAHEAEIEAIRRAIDRSGRPMVLSLSPGATALSGAEHVKQHANLWRISDDFWDNWDVLREQFARLADWNVHRGPGHWPDADMLPFGVLDLGRRSSRFTRDEQRTVMTLWSIARSPLMHGGDMTKMDEWTLSLLTQPELIALNQDSRDNRPVFDDDGLVAWTATGATGERYLALFNARDRFPLNDERRIFEAALDGGAHAFQTALVDVSVAPGTIIQLVADDGRGGNGDHHAVVWGDPVLQGPAGEVSLLDLPWEHATSRWGSVTSYRAPGERELLLGGRPLDRGLLVHTKSVIALRVPEGYERLVAECGFEGTSLPRGEGSSSRCAVYRELDSSPNIGETQRSSEAGATISVNLDTLGLELDAGGASASTTASASAARPVRAHVVDVWTGADLGVFEAVFSTTIPWHGVGLFRLRALPR
ncbi:MAG TPA: NPCBM/NEW2 domain-containing protein [Polyangiaceae bacterium]|nr:NPCBM/NEW2 domain-containing protein [Polyangiaceae bacterium]